MTSDAPAVPAEVYPPSPPAAAAEGTAPPAVAPPPESAATAPETESTPEDAPSQIDHSAGVRALQEAFAIDVAEREDRHRAEVRAMQQSFMTDVGAREERHRAEVQVLHQRLAAEIAERDERHRGEVAALQQTLEQTRTQLTDVTSHRDREAQTRAAHEVELERLRTEIDTQASEIARLSAKSSDLASSLAATRQQADQWNERARHLEAELAFTREEAEKAAADAAAKYGAKTRVLEDTERKLEDTTRKLAVAEERGNRLADQSAAHDAAAQQLRNTVAEQRAERERVTAERDEARQQAAEFEGQLRRVEFEAEQADEEATRHLNEANRKIEVAEEQIARLAGQVTVHEATIEELRRAAADAQIEMKKVTVDRDAAKRRVATLETEVARLERETTPGLITADDAAPSEETSAAAEPAEAESTWSAPELSSDVEVSDERPLALSSDIDLLPWQTEALTAWARAGHRGVVEAVSGAGKTALAHWAIALAVDEGMKVLVIAPTPEQVDGWYDGLRAALPINRVAKQTGAKDEHVGSADVVVTTAEDAAQQNIFGTSFKVMLVADQVHTLGTREASKALDPLYSWRLGLSAVYQRDDAGIATYLDPYFGRVSFRLGYARALADGVVAPFELAIVPVSLNTAEQAEYDALGKQIEELATQLVGEFGVPTEPAEAFESAVETLADGRMGPPRTTARTYQKVVAKRSELVTKAAAKASVLKALAGHIRDTEPALIFTQSQAEATSLTKLFGNERCPTRSLSGGGERKLLGRRSDDARDTDDVRLAAGSGDGEATLGLIVGASGGKHQLVQRLGSIIGRGAGERPARLVVAYVEGTPEDDYSAADATLTATVAPYAARQQRFAATELVGLLEFLTGVEEPAEPEDDAAE